MLQVYSSNLSVDANTVFPFNNIVINKGCAEVLSAPATIQLNKQGVYLVEMDGFATPDAATEVSVQLMVNGVAQPQAISSFVPAAITDTRTFGFKTFVRVFENNCKCNCLTSPTILQLMNGATALTDAHINVVITKIV
jgi:hypothetical protein